MAFSSGAMLSDKYDSANRAHRWDQRLNKIKIKITYSRGAAKCAWNLLGNWLVISGNATDHHNQVMTCLYPIAAGCNFNRITSHLSQSWSRLALTWAGPKAFVKKTNGTFGRPELCSHNIWNASTASGIGFRPRQITPSMSKQIPYCKRNVITFVNKIHRSRSPGSSKTLYTDPERQLLLQLTR